MDNYEKIVNPTNMKTPPPPIWGETLEEDNFDSSEDFYNHDKAMKALEQRKVSDLAKIEAQGGPKT